MYAVRLLILEGFPTRTALIQDCTFNKSSPNGRFLVLNINIFNWFIDGVDNWLLMTLYVLEKNPTRMPNQDCMLIVFI